MARSNKTKISVLHLFSFLFLFERLSTCGALQVGFYGSKCPKAESIIEQVVKQQVMRNRSLAAALLRLQFHDCFVKGCDASILIDSVKVTESSEKNASDSFFLRGFNVIDEIKASLEAQCPSTVSCADIIAVAARDAVALAGGPKYQVPTGRRDGLRSVRDDVDLPQPDFPVGLALEYFTDNGLNLADMVTLLGAHTIGVAHCSSFENRLQRFGNHSFDPTMDPALKAKLSKLCSKASDSEATAFLDQGTSFVFDNSFYRQLLKKRGVLRLDQLLSLNNSTSGLVSKFAADNGAFMKSFAKSIVKMGKVKVLTGEEGEVRTNCRVFNHPI